MLWCASRVSKSLKLNKNFVGKLGGLRIVQFYYPLDIYLGDSTKMIFSFLLSFPDPSSLLWSNWLCLGGLVGDAHYIHLDVWECLGRTGGNSRFVTLLWAQAIPLWVGWWTSSVCFFFRRLCGLVWGAWLLLICSKSTSLLWVF